MKLSLLIIATCIACSNGFVVLKTTTRTTSTASHETSSSLEMNGFLDGREKNKIMKDEDEAMWVDDDDDFSGWNPFVNKKAQPVPVAKPVAAPKMQNPFAPKEKVEAPIKEAPKKAFGGFKFPWDK